MSRVIDAPGSDIFDVLAFVAFASPPMSRAARIEDRKASVLKEHQGELERFLDFVLRQYVKEGVDELDDDKLPELLDLHYGGVSEAAAQLGGVVAIRNAFMLCQRNLLGVSATNPI